MKTTLDPALAKHLLVFGCVLAATIVEASGDAVVRIGLFERGGWGRAAMLAGGAALLFAYGVFINAAPLPFERVVGLYIATLFCVWTLTSLVFFGTRPSPQVLVGGALIVVGGLVVTFWPAR